MKNKKQKIYPGFSLIEMVIAIFIFSLITLVSISVFSSTALVEKKSQKIQQDLESATTSLELMAKNMKMSNQLDYIIAGDKTGVYMFNASQQLCIEYKFDNNNQELQMATAAPYFDSNSGGVSCKPVDVSYNAYVAIMKKTTGQFKITKTDIASNKIGMGTVIITVDGTDHLQMTASFRDYFDIIQ